MRWGIKTKKWGRRRCVRCRIVSYHLSVAHSHEAIAQKHFLPGHQKWICQRVCTHPECGSERVWSVSSRTCRKENGVCESAKGYYVEGELLSATKLCLLHASTGMGTEKWISAMNSFVFLRVCPALLSRARRRSFNKGGGVRWGREGDSSSKNRGPWPTLPAVSPKQNADREKRPRAFFAEINEACPRVMGSGVEPQTKSIRDKVISRSA